MSFAESVTRRPFLTATFFVLLLMPKALASGQAVSVQPANPGMTYPAPVLPNIPGVTTLDPRVAQLLNSIGPYDAPTGPVLTLPNRNPLGVPNQSAVPIPIPGANNLNNPIVAGPIVPAPVVPTPVVPNLNIAPNGPSSPGSVIPPPIAIPSLTSPYGTGSSNLETNGRLLRDLR